MVTITNGADAKIKQVGIDYSAVIEMTRIPVWCELENELRELNGLRH